ncbi:methylated-DNA--[protein]-cysteine S-methyltransferase [Neisseria shayeganii]|uniref:methylated-DNA--[protein]-cysteine S-methyltransferase n=1 Tax=Neisseria shayeganii TaxID=607712 RepID=A0A7D7RVV4_9NEIS|nr:methylated-DNA--[protein]-cysteine S-methyltransferase [Neisseria shayeganii]QMT41124.1 methylated-DNA--[protein]-cysteine S-methyltransferase [Neisseria shayeganii]
MEYCYIAPFGTLLCRHDGTHFTEIVLGTQAQNFLPPLPDNLARDFDRYFAGNLKTFRHPVSPKGTPFQQRVWAEIAAIPAGQVRSYREIAQRIGSHPRPVGSACGKNPLPLLIPCHRVVAADGSLGGFSMGADPEQGLNIKRWLLAHEGVNI